MIDLLIALGIGASFVVFAVCLWLLKREKTKKKSRAAQTAEGVSVRTRRESSSGATARGDGGSATGDCPTGASRSFFTDAFLHRRFISGGRRAGGGKKSFHIGHLQSPAR